MKVHTIALNWYRPLGLAAAFALSVSLLLVSSASPQTRGVSAAQAARGATVYAKSCASCHGKNLEGTTSTALTGSAFTAKWGDARHSIDDLYFVIRTQMPYGAAGTLTNKQYIDVVAYILQRNGYAAGGKELAADSAVLKQVKIAFSGAAEKTDVAGKAGTGPAKTPASSSTRPANSKPTQAELNAAQSTTTDWLMSNHDYGGQRFDISQSVVLD